MVQKVSNRDNQQPSALTGEGSETKHTEPAIVETMVNIYVLIDPRDNEIRYVGKTKNTLNDRLAQHMDDVIYKNEQNWRTHWIAQMLRQGYRPRIELIQEVPDSFWRLAEPYWIAYYRAIGCRLTNGTEGGDGGYSPTPEVRAKYGVANIGNSYRLGKSHTDETKAIISEATRRAWAEDPTFRERVVASKTGQLHTDETKEKMSVAHRKRYEDPSVRAKQSEALKGKPKTPAAVANMSAAQQARRARERANKAG